MHLKEKILYCIENKRLDAYFSKYKLGIKVDEYNHEGRNSYYEKSRKLMIESHRITIPEYADFDINKLINQYTRTLLNQLKNKPKYQLKNH